MKKKTKSKWVSSSKDGDFGVWVKEDGSDELVFYPSDEVLKEDGKYWVSYAQGTKVRMFNRKVDAIKFMRSYRKKY